MPYLGNSPVAGDHVNNFKVLDDISSYTETFDGSASTIVSTSNNTIRVVDHRFIQGQRVTYTNGGGGNIGGLTTGTAYFVIFDTASTFKLATNASNAANSVAINLSSVGSGSSHTLNAAFDGVNTKFKITYNTGTAARFNNATQLNIAINNVLQKPNLNSITFTEGFAIEDNHKIVFKVAPTSQDIFWGSIIANTLTTFDISDHKIDTFTGDGSTTEFTLSHTPANNESLMVTINGVLQHPSNTSTARAYTLIASIIQFTAAPGVGDEIQVRHLGFAGATTADVSGFYGRTGNVVLTSNDHITTGNINAGIVTATSFHGSFSPNVGGSNANFTGIVTAGVFKGGDFDGRNLNISGIATFAGNVSIGGTLTYEDVTNIDSVGIISARKDIHVGAGISAVGIITGQFLMASGGSDANKQNVKIGWMQSENLTTGMYNVIVGRRAGENVSTGNNVVIIGANAGAQLSTQTGGVFIGNNAGHKIIRTNNVIIGSEAAQQSTDSQQNVIIGTYAGIDNQGNENTLIGYYSGRGNSGVTDGTRNTFVGAQSGFKIEGGDDNTSVGRNSLRELLGGNKNVAIGQQAGDALVSGNNNIIIGYQADASTSTTSNEITLGDANIKHLRVPGIGVSFNNTGGTQLGIITATELDISGDIDVDGHTELDNGNVSGVVTFTNSPNAIQMNDDARVSFGTSLKTSISYNSSDSRTKIRNYNDTLEIGYRTTELHYINQARLTIAGSNTFSADANTTFTGANYSTSWIPSTNTFRFNDNAKLALGTQSDTEFYHNGANLYLQNDTGHIYIQNNVAADVDKNIYLQAKNGENSITCENDGEVYLFSNQVSANQQKLRTSNTGIYVTGIGTFTDKVSVTGSQNSMLTNNQLIFDRAGTSYIDNTNDSGSLSFRIGSSYTVGLFIDSSANVSIPSKLMHHGDTDTFLEFNSNTINFDTAGKERLRINSAGRIKINHNQTPGQLDDTWLSIYDANSDSSANDPAGISKNYAMIALHNYGTGSPGDVAGIAFGAASSFAYTKSSIAHERTGSYGTGDLVFLTNNDQDTTLVNNTDERMRITRDGKIGIGHHIATQINSELTIRPADDGGILLGRPGDTVAPINKALTITTTTTGSEAYHTKYHTYNCNSIFTTYEGGGTGGNLIFKTGVGNGNDVERLRITSTGEVVISPRNGGASNNRTSIHFNNSAHTPFIAFKSNNLTEAAYIQVPESNGGAEFNIRTKNTSGTLLSRLTLKNNGEIVTHQLAGNEKGYPLVMGTGTVANNTEMSGSFNYHDFMCASTGGGNNYQIGGWVFLGNDYGPNPYPARRFQIAKPGGFTNGTLVYQVWHNGDSNYLHGGLWEIRINCWTGSSRFESVAIRCVNGSRDDMRVVAYNDSKGIMIQPSSIWGQVFIRKAGWDDGGRNPGSSYCAVANNGALAIYNSQGTDDGSMPSGGVNLYPFDGTSGSAGATHTGGYYIENGSYFDG